MSDRRRRGGLIGLIGTGIGAATEYHAHRQEQKQQRLSRENSQQDNAAVAGPSTAPRREHSNQGASEDLPPSYAESSRDGGERSLASGGRSMDDKKAALSQYDEDSSDDDDELSTEDDEEDWELDEVANGSKGLPSYEESEADFRTTGELVRDVMSTSRSKTSEKPKLCQPLPLPVIVPQRRPRNKACGFVRAYAPVLEDSGIDQKTFMTFLDNFDKSSQASPVWTVIQVSAGIAGLAPSLIAMAVTTAAQVAAGAAKEIQSRQRTNRFLDQMNEQLFKPNGLYAFIMKYKPESEAQQGGLASRLGVKPQVVDMSTNQIVAKYGRTVSEEERSMSDRMKGIRLASGTTQGAVRLPEAAPLIFPAIDKAVAQNGVEETFKDKAKDARVFLADYLDRRAQLQYARSDPNSAFAVPEEQRAFRSKFADPHHPMYQGGLIAFATGGAVNPRAAKRERKAGRRYEKDERRALKYEQRMDNGRDLTRKKQARYDNFLAEQERMGLGGRSGYRDDFAGDRFGGRRRGRGGLVSGLIGAAANASSGRSGPGSGRSREYEDAYLDQSRYGSQYSKDPRRRSYDGRDAYGASGAPSDQYSGYRRRANRQKQGGAISAVRRIMREDVLYLMIVNLPSESEFIEAQQEMERVKSR